MKKLSLDDCKSSRQSKERLYNGWFCSKFEKLLLQRDPIDDLVVQRNMNLKDLTQDEKEDPGIGDPITKFRRWQFNPTPPTNLLIIRKVVRAVGQAPTKRQPPRKNVQWKTVTSKLKSIRNIRDIRTVTKRGRREHTTSRLVSDTKKTLIKRIL